mmetsp:Transcript_44471/g.123683  ORF Transcript_44471/g.123683 Transcript_44471/m.123683 type:complete len:289 (-) Transcript_44471:146-1012(-)
MKTSQQMLLRQLRLFRMLMKWREQKQWCRQAMNLRWPMGRKPHHCLLRTSLLRLFHKLQWRQLPRTPKKQRLRRHRPRRRQPRGSQIPWGLGSHCRQLRTRRSQQARKRRQFNHPLRRRRHKTSVRQVRKPQLERQLRSLLLRPRGQNRLRWKTSLPLPLRRQKLHHQLRRTSPLRLLRSLSKLRRHRSHHCLPRTSLPRTSQLRRPQQLPPQPRPWQRPLPPPRLHPQLHRTKYPWVRPRLRQRLGSRPHPCRNLLARLRPRPRLCLRPSPRPSRKQVTCERERCAR